MKFVRPFLCFLLLLMPSAPRFAAKAAQRPVSTIPAKPAVAWVFVIKRDKNLTPRSSVFLRVAGKSTLVFQGIDEFRTLARADYKEHHVPADALAACTGWWAGQGDDLYVVRRKQRFEVYRRELDEQSGPFPVKRIKSIVSPRY